MDIKIGVFTERHQSVPKIRLPLGQSFNKLGKKEEAINQFNQAKSVFNFHYGPNYTKIELVHNELINSWKKEA